MKRLKCEQDEVRLHIRVTMPSGPTKGIGSHERWG